MWLMYLLVSEMWAVGFFMSVIMVMSLDEKAVLLGEDPKPTWFIVLVILGWPIMWPFIYFWQSLRKR